MKKLFTLYLFLFAISGSFAQTSFFFKNDFGLKFENSHVMPSVSAALGVSFFGQRLNIGLGFDYRFPLKKYNNYHDTLPAKVNFYGTKLLLEYIINPKANKTFSFELSSGIAHPSIIADSIMPGDINLHDSYFYFQPGINYYFANHEKGLVLYCVSLKYLFTTTTDLSNPGTRDYFHKFKGLTISFAYYLDILKMGNSRR